MAKDAVTAAYPLSTQLHSCLRSAGAGLAGTAQSGTFLEAVCCTSGKAACTQKQSGRFSLASTSSSSPHPLSSSLCLRTLLATVLDPVGPTEWRRTPLHLHKVVRGWRNEKKKCIEEKANTDSFHFLSTYSLLC